MNTVWRQTNWRKLISSPVLALLSSLTEVFHRTIIFVLINTINYVGIHVFFLCLGHSKISAWNHLTDILQWERKTVNHSRHMVDPITGHSEFVYFSNNIPIQKQIIFIILLLTIVQTPIMLILKCQESWILSYHCHHWTGNHISLSSLNRQPY